MALRFTLTRAHWKNGKPVIGTPSFMDHGNHKMVNKRTDFGSQWQDKIPIAGKMRYDLNNPRRPDWYVEPTNTRPDPYATEIFANEMYPRKDMNLVQFWWANIENSKLQQGVMARAETNFAWAASLLLGFFILAKTYDMELPPHHTHEEHVRLHALHAVTRV